MPKFIKERLRMVDCISGSTHSYVKIGSVPFWENFCLTYILCSSLLCSWQGPVIFSKVGPFTLFCFFDICIVNKPFLFISYCKLIHNHIEHAITVISKWQIAEKQTNAHRSRPEIVTVSNHTHSHVF